MQVCCSAEGHRKDVYLMLTHFVIHWAALENIVCQIEIEAAVVSLKHFSLNGVKTSSLIWAQLMRF